MPGKRAPILHGAFCRSYPGRVYLYFTAMRSRTSAALLTRVTFGGLFCVWAESRKEHPQASPLNLMEGCPCAHLIHCAPLLHADWPRGTKVVCKFLSQKWSAWSVSFINTKISKKSNVMFIQRNASFTTAEASVNVAAVQSAQLHSRTPSTVCHRQKPYIIETLSQPVLQFLVG